MASKTVRMYPESISSGVAYEDTSFPEIRKCLAPSYQRLPDEYIEQIIDQSFGEGVNPEDIEGLFGDIGNFVKKGATSVAKAMPAILPVAGTVVGTAFGGPLGAAVGGSLGSALGGVVGKAVSPGGQKAPAFPLKPAGALGTIAGIAGSALGGKTGAALGSLAGAVGPAMGGQPAAASGGAAVELIKALLQPKVMQGIQSMAMGQTGKQTIPIAGTQVPVSAIANLIGTLANQAVEEHHARQLNMGESDFSYLLNSEGMPIVDPASPEQRASVVLSLLQQESINRLHLQEQWQQRTAAVSRHNFESQEDIDHYYDMLELASLHEENLDERELY